MPTIPFTQYYLPDGRKRPVEAQVPKDLSVLAQKLIDKHNCRFEVEMLRDGHTVSMSIVGIAPGELEERDVELVLAENEPNSIDNALRKLVTAGARRYGELP